MEQLPLSMHIAAAIVDTCEVRCADDGLVLYARSTDTGLVEAVSSSSNLRFDFYQNDNFPLQINAGSLARMRTPSVTAWWMDLSTNVFYEQPMHCEDSTFASP